MTLVKEVSIYKHHGDSESVVPKEQRSNSSGLYRTRTEASHFERGG